MAEMMWMKRSISIDSGVSLASALEARFAIWPMTVRSPVLMAMPLPLPAEQEVPKKQQF